MKCPIMMKVALSSKVISNPLRRYKELLTGSNIRLIKNKYYSKSIPLQHLPSGGTNMSNHYGEFGKFFKELAKEKDKVKKTRIATGIGLGVTGSVALINNNKKQ